MMSVRLNDRDLGTDLNNLRNLDRNSLIQEWRKRFRSSPPKYTSSQFLKLALSYELQCRRSGGLSAEVKRGLRSVLVNGKVVDASNPAPGSSVTPLLSAGTELIREWNGRNYQVQVTDDGFLLDGKKYRSLSAIARKITGARWSGPRFFGLNGNADLNHKSTQSGNMA